MAWLTYRASSRATWVRYSRRRTRNPFGLSVQPDVTLWSDGTSLTRMRSIMSASRPSHSLWSPCSSRAEIVVTFSGLA